MKPKVHLSLDLESRHRFHQQAESSHRDRRNQSAKPPRDRRERIPGFREFRHLEVGVASMLDYFGADFDQLVLQVAQRTMTD